LTAVTAATTAARIFVSEYAGAAVAGSPPGIAEDIGRSRSVGSVAGVVGNGGGADVPATRPLVGAAVPDLLRLRADLPARHPDYAVLHTRVMEARLPLARYLASRYRFDVVTERRTLRPLLAALRARQRRILALRYFADLSRTGIAVRIGPAQMQFSRLLIQTLTPLRTGLLAEQPARSTCLRPGRLT
jgi:hypothetical protein